MVIWALNHKTILFKGLADLTRIPIKFVVPSYHDNPNINAQKGVLSYVEVDKEPLYRFQTDNNNPIDSTPLDKYILSLCDGRDETLLYRFEIPIADCGKAISAVWELGYNAARLFPGFNGVTAYLDEEYLGRRISKRDNP